MRKDVRNEIMRIGDNNINESEMARIKERLRLYNEEFETWEDLDKIVKEIIEDINNEVV